VNFAFTEFSEVRQCFIADPSPTVNKAAMSSENAEGGCAHEANIRFGAVHIGATRLVCGALPELHMALQRWRNRLP
jgi:hypothetical protein